MIRSARRCILGATGLAIGAASPPAAAAQAIAGFGHPRADSLLAAGAVARAESLYYATANLRPRDPVARAALGRYIAARGAFKVGAVLLEEARRFGADAAAIALDLAPLYERSADYAALARLPQSPLSDAERGRTAWLVTAGPTSRAAAPRTLVRYRPAGREPGSVGTVTVRIGGAVHMAILDPEGNGVRVRAQSALAARLRFFGTGAAGERVAVAESLSIGGLALTQVPVTIAPVSGSDISIGIGFLARFSPSFDSRDSSLTLHAAGIPRDPSAIRLPVLFTARGPRILVDGHWLAMGDPGIAVLMAGARLTLDTRRGELAVAR